MADKIPHFDEIVKLFSKGPPVDSAVHGVAEKLGLDPDDFEEEIYELLAAFLAHGRSKDFTGKYDQEQIKMGIKVEHEHTIDNRIAERIAKDHLAEFPDYYTRLDKMESEARTEKKASLDEVFEILNKC
jgi:hypothetical protein